MHDRRIVRGNTFAALVIPLSKFTTTNQFRHAIVRDETCEIAQN